MIKKRLFSLLLILSLIFSLSVAAYGETDRFVFDETGQITGEELQTLDNLGARIYADTGAAVCLCLSNETGEDLHSFAQRFWADSIGADDGILLVHNPETSMISYAAFGEKCAALGEEKLTALAEAYNSGASYFEGAHSYMNLAYASLGGPGLEVPDERQLALVTDSAGVIDADTLAALNTLAENVSEKYDCDVAVAFVQSLDGKYVVDYSDDFFWYNGYGQGPERDGILLLISVSDREFNESTSGYAITAFTDYGLQQYIEPNFTRYLADGRDDWAGAARQFITDAEELMRQAKEGQPYDNYTQAPAARERTRANTGVAAIISVIVGFFSGAIPAGAMKRKLKSVEKHYGAANYVRGGLHMRRSDDRFLYANVHKTPIPREQHRSGGGGGGSSGHFSSSGHSFGGSHGKF